MERYFVVRSEDFDRMVGVIGLHDPEVPANLVKGMPEYFPEQLDELIEFCAAHPEFHLISYLGSTVVNHFLPEACLYSLGRGDSDPRICHEYRGWNYFVFRLKEYGIPVGRATFHEPPGLRRKLAVEQIEQMREIYCGIPPHPDTALQFALQDDVYDPLDGSLTADIDGSPAHRRFRN